MAVESINVEDIYFNFSPWSLHRVYRRDMRSTIHWQVSNGCWPEPAMVVESINVEDIYFNLSPWFFPLLYPGHLGFLPMKKTNTVMLSLQRYKHSYSLKPSLGVRELLSSCL